MKVRIPIEKMRRVRPVKISNSWSRKNIERNGRDMGRYVSIQRRWCWHKIAKYRTITCAATCPRVTIPHTERSKCGRRNQLRTPVQSHHCTPRDTPQTAHSNRLPFRVDSISTNLRTTPIKSFKFNSSSPPPLVALYPLRLLLALSLASLSRAPPKKSLIWHQPLFIA